MKVLLLILVAMTIHSHGVAQQASSTNMKVIDGAKNPELVPRLEAYKGMFSMLGDGFGSSAVSFAVAYLKPAELTKEEMNLVLRTSNKYAVAVDELRSRIAKIKSGEKNRPQPAYSSEAQRQISDAMSEFNQTAENLQNSLLKELGPEAAMRLERLVETKVKSGMHLYQEEKK